MTDDGEDLAVAVSGVAVAIAGRLGVPAGEVRAAIEAWLLDHYAAAFPVEVRVQRYVSDPEGCPLCRPGRVCHHHANAARLRERAAQLREQRPGGAR